MCPRIVNFGQNYLSHIPSSFRLFMFAEDPHFILAPHQPFQLGRAQFSLNPQDLGFISWGVISR